MSEHIRADQMARLRSKDSDERAKAVAEIRRQLSDSEATGCHGSQNPIYQELNKTMLRLQRSSDSLDRLACTAVLAILVNMETLEEAQRTRIAVQIKNLLSGADIAVNREAVKIYSKLIGKRWAMASSTMEAEVKRSLEWLGNERNDVRRMTAILVLEASCKSAPTAMYSYVYKVLTALNMPLKDHILEIRLAAAEALGACLALVTNREITTKNQWLNYLYEEMHTDQRSASIECLHAALLICQELVLRGGMFMRAHYGEASEMVFKLKDHRDPLIHRTAISLFPVLARFSPSDFIKFTINGESLMSHACNYLLGLARTTERDRGIAFTALGNISITCTSDFRPFIEPTTRAIRNTFAMRIKQRPPPVESEDNAEILETIALLAQAMGPALTRYVRELLDLMFTTGLSHALCNALEVLEREVGQLSAAIQDRLLDMVSIILTSVPFRPKQPSLDSLESRMGTMSLHYAPPSSAQQSGHAISDVANSRPMRNTSSLVNQTAKNTRINTDTIVLALKTLSTFSFSSENLSEFVRNDVLGYLSNGNSTVRKEAIRAVSHIVFSDPLYWSMAGAGGEVVSDVVQYLIATAVTDLDSDVRLMAVQMLERESYFDMHMGKAQNIQSLFLLLNDEVFEVRRTVLGVVGRLANMNPAHVMPSLRRMVVQLLTELEFAESNSEREECIQLLMILVRAAENWVRPYVADIFRTILPRIDGASPQLASRLFDTVATLARVGSSDLASFMDDLLASIICALDDQSTTHKRLSALRALSNCASFCGLVISPYESYPQLFDTLTYILKTEQDEDTRIEVMRTIGAIGAIDPHDYKDIKNNALKSGSAGSSSNHSAGSGASSGTAAHSVSNADMVKRGGRGKHGGKRRKNRNAGAIPPNVMTVFNNEEPYESLIGDTPVDHSGKSFSNDEYYTSVSTNALLGILNSPTEAMYHREAVQAIISMFGTIPSTCTAYLDRVVPAILHSMQAAVAGQAEFYIESLGRLVGISKQLIRPYLGPVFELFDTEAPLSSAHQQTATIGLIEVLAEAVSGDFGRHISTVLPFLVSVITNDTTENHQPTLRALHALRILGPSLDGYLFLVMPQLISLLKPHMQPSSVIEAALETITSIVTAVNCRSFSSRIVLTLVRLLQLTPSQSQQGAIIDTLCALMQQIQDEFTLFMPTISAAMQKRGIVHHGKYERYSRLLFSGRLIPKDEQKIQPTLQIDASQPEIPLGAADGGRKLRVNVLSLRRAWSTTQRVSKEDWLGWLNQFSVELLQQSPSPALRACSNLAFKYPKLNQVLFNPAFVSCWTELPGQYQQEIIAALQEVASNERVPSEILQMILSLAEFMERDEKQIPIDLKLLEEYASRCHALVKELHYNETEWMLEKNYDTIGDLIQLNQDLDQHDAAIGMLNHVRKELPQIDESVEWYNRLQRWDEALAIYHRMEKETGPTYHTINGKVRCLFEMSDWENLIPMLENIHRSGDEQTQISTVNVAMNVAWALGDMDHMEEYLAVLPSHSKDRAFCRALLSVYRNKFDEAAEHIREARLEMESDLSAHLTESYSRGYVQVFRCQLLTELEEVVAFKTMNGSKERCAAIANTWRRRLSSIQRDVGMWQKLLRLHCMVLRPIEDLDTWIKFVNLCRKSDQMRIAKQIIGSLLTDEAKMFEEIGGNNGELNGSVLGGLISVSGEPDLTSRSSTMISQGGNHAPAQAIIAHQDSNNSTLHVPMFGYLGASGGIFDVRQSDISLDSAIERSQQPGLVYTYLKYKWANNERREAYQMLDQFAERYSSLLGFNVHHPEAFYESLDSSSFSIGTNGGRGSGSNHLDSRGKAEVTQLLARFYFKRAEWLTSIQQSASLVQEAKNKAAINPEDPHYLRRFDSQGRRDTTIRRHGRGSISVGTGNNSNTNGVQVGSDAAAAAATTTTEVTEADRDAEFLLRLRDGQVQDTILASYKAATFLDRKWYKAWHSLALRHYYEIQKYENEGRPITDEILEQHVVPSVHGFFRAIQLSDTGTTLQDTLRLLTVWFGYSQHASVAQAVHDGFNSVPIRTWLQVIPQVLARIHTQYESTSRLIKQLLVNVGKFHPHAILFSLYVAARSSSQTRSRAAKDVLEKLHDLCPELVEETEVVSRELIRVTLLFPEMWLEALDIASKHYFGQHDPMSMIAVFKPLHECVKHPETLREYHFVQVFGNELTAAEEYCNKYLEAPEGRRNDAFIQQAWESYYVIFRGIQKLFPPPTHLVLKDTAPRLLECHDMHLAVPGTYDPDNEIVRIASFDPVFSVYNTKQHPRKVGIQGSDGNKYTFVLKGHEDLRQDERVMQLFGLINSLLVRDPETSQRSLAIERYPAIPLSSNSGLIGFYPNCETIHEIIKEYREAHNQQLNLEQRMALQFSPNWETLTVLQKVESFEYTMHSTPGSDLQRAFWYKSPNAELWLERRTNYTRSLAVMSMAGYILGLGDRHPSNIMMHSSTGKIVHIDFGDCFELAAHREKFPEKIPFRLTRMLIMAMEVSTIEGTFKFTSNHTMRVLRANRDSLMAVLEAFIFDPLVSWSYIYDPDSMKSANNSSNGNNGIKQNRDMNEFNNEKSEGSATTRNLGTRAGTAATTAALGNGGSRPNGKEMDNREWQMGNPKAMAIVNRISSKLIGTDFDPNVQLAVADQVDKLIAQATSSENLAVLYPGWVPMW